MRHKGDAVHITDVLAKVLGRDYLMSDRPDELAAVPGFISMLPRLSASRPTSLC